MRSGAGRGQTVCPPLTPPCSPCVVYEPAQMWGAGQSGRGNRKSFRESVGWRVADSALVTRDLKWLLSALG